MKYKTAIYQLGKRTPALKRQHWKWVTATLLIVCTGLYFQLDFNAISIPITTNIEKPEQQELPTKTTEDIVKAILGTTQKALLDNSYKDKNAANFRVKRLKKMGLNAMVDDRQLYDTDFDITEQFFVFIQGKEDDLMQIHNKYQKALFEADLPVLDGEMITLIPKSY